MKKIYVLISFLMILTMNLYSQVNVTLIIQKPLPAKISQWQQNPLLIQVLVANTTPNPYDYVSMSAKLRDENGKVIAYTKSNDPNIPHFNIPPAPQTKLMQFKDVLKYESLEFDQSIKSIVLATNSLPEGNYQLCVTITNAWGTITNGGEACDYINISLSDPPELLSPANNQTLQNAFPQFIWSPVFGIEPGIIVEYKLKIVKLFEGQSAKAGVESNPSYLEKNMIGTSYQYLPTDFNLDTYNDPNGWAWQIQALNSVTKQPVTGKNGKSEAWKFFNKKGDPRPLILVSPLNNTVLSINNTVYSFSWDGSKQKKTKTAYIMKIVEIKAGQTPEFAMTTNPPVYYRDDIPVSQSGNYPLQDNLGFLVDGRNYAWQIWTFSEPWGGIIDTSEVWRFEVNNNTMEKIAIVTPLNDATSEINPQKFNAYYFEWNASNVKKSITSFTFTVTEILENQSPGEALHDNTPVYKMDKINPSIKSQIIAPDAGVFKDKKYAWQVTAYSTSWGTQPIARSEITTVNIINSIPQLDSVKQFKIGKYSVNVKSVTNKTATNFCGTGDVTLWMGGPVITIKFDKLHLIRVVQSEYEYFKVKAGQIWTDVTQTEIPLDFSEPGLPGWITNSEHKSDAKLRITTIRLDSARSEIFAFIKVTSPMILANGTNCLLKSGGSWFSISPANSNSVNGSTNLATAYNSELLLSPLNYKFDLAMGGEMKITDRKLTLKLTGSITLPPNQKDKDGNPVKINFKNVGGFYFNTNIEQNYNIFYKLASNGDVLWKLNDADVDLYSGIITINKGVLILNKQKVGISDIPLDLNDNCYFNSKGFNCYILRTSQNQKVYFRGYDFSLNNLFLMVKDNVIGSYSKIKGVIKIPFINIDANLDVNFTNSGISNGNVQILSSAPIEIYRDNKEVIKVSIASIGYYPSNNFFCMNAYFSFEGQGTPGSNFSTTTNIAVPSVYIDSTGGVFVYGANSEGWINLNVTKSGIFNNYPVSISKFQLRGKYSYVLGVSGSIVLASDLSNPSGTPFAASMEIPKQTSGGKSGGSIESPENLPSGELKVDQIPLNFGNNQSAFGASVKWFDNDPVYGKGFMASTNLTMHNPGDFSVSSKIMIGKTNNGTGFTYWFLETDVTLPTAIPTGLLELGIKRFSGRIYSRMRHNGGGILASDYVPDNTKAFGVYAHCGLMTMSDGGVKIWGNLALEITVGNGFTATLYGDVNILSSGYGNTDGKIKGNATIITSSNPKLFDSEVNVSADLWGALCANGQMKLHISENDFYFNLGTEQNPVTTRILCGGSAYNGYVMINKSSATIGGGFDYDTGYREWGAGIGCWGRAWGGIKLNGTLFYSPIQVVASASLYGSGQIGVFVNVRFYKGRLTLLSGSVSANMQVTFPDPLCFAGSIHAEGCIDPCPIGSCDICFGATLKIRYKNGVFALKSTCND